MPIQVHETLYAPGSRRGLLLCALLACYPAAPRAAAPSGGGYEVISSVLRSGGERLTGGGYLSRGAAAQALPDNRGQLTGGGYASRSGFYNPPHFTYQKALLASLSFAAGAAALSLPAGSVEKEYFDITVNKNPLSAPLNSDPSAIKDANSKLSLNSDSWSTPLSGNLSEICLFDEQSYWDRPFLKPGSLTLSYADADGDGILDGSNPPVRVETVRTWLLDDSVPLWSKLPSAGLDAGSRSVIVPLLTPGVYALMGMLDESVKDVYAFPVPFRPNGPAAGLGAGRTGTEAEGVTFMNVPQAGNIEIYTLDGRLVRKLPIPAGLVIPKIKWDVRTEGGARAASGTYIWRAVSGGNSRAGKLMIIW